MVTEIAPQPQERRERAPEELEGAVLALLRAYRDALAYAADMPFFGRSRTSRRPRFGSRPLTRVYVESHVRTRLGQLARGLRLEHMAAAEEARAALADLEARLHDARAPLLGWRRVAQATRRLPPVAALVPVLGAFAAASVNEGVSLGDAARAAVILAGVALVLWVLVVWPSIRFGFRVKRAILAGGRDLDRPITDKPEVIEWLGFPDDYEYDGSGLFRELTRSLLGRKERTLRPFPQESAYAAENRVFAALGRRKPAEVPVDMILGFGVYISFGLAAFAALALVDIARDPGDTSYQVWLLVPVLLLLLALPAQVVLQGMRNYRMRRH